MQNKTIKWTLVSIEFVLLTAFFSFFYFYVCEDRIVDATEFYLYDVLPVGLWVLILLLVNATWIAIMAKTSFVKNPYLKTAIFSFLLATSIVIGWALLYLTGLDGIA